MKHPGTKPLETTRLTLRPFLPEDADAMFRNWASDPEVTKYLTWPTHTSPEVSRWVLSDWCSHYSDETFCQWAIVPRELGEPIGSIAVVSRSDSAGWVEIGYCIGRNWWHRGYMSEALKALIAFFFEETDVTRIQAVHDPRNSNSGAVMVKCGMRYEGTLRQAGVNNQGICDMAYYSILKEEYETAKSGLQPVFLREPETKRYAASRILCQLPDWFGIPQMVQEYAKEAIQLPCWAVYDGPLPVGFAMLKPTGEKTAEIYALGLEPGYHRRGLGRKLLTALESWAFRQGFVYLQAKTLATGTCPAYDRTNLFFRAMGFRELECFPNLWDPHNPCQIWVKAIGSADHPALPASEKI